MWMAARSTCEHNQSKVSVYYVNRRNRPPIITVAIDDGVFMVFC